MPAGRPGSVRPPAPRSSWMANLGRDDGQCRFVARYRPHGGAAGRVQPSCSLPRSRTPRAGLPWPGWPRNRRRCGVSRRCGAGGGGGEVFRAVAEEVGRLLPVEYAASAAMSRRCAEHGRSLGQGLDHIPVGTRGPWGERTSPRWSSRTGRPARIDSYAISLTRALRTASARWASAQRSGRRSSSTTASGV